VRQEIKGVEKIQEFLSGNLNSPARKSRECGEGVLETGEVGGEKKKGRKYTQKEKKLPECCNLWK